MADVAGAEIAKIYVLDAAGAGWRIPRSGCHFYGWDEGFGCILRFRLYEIDEWVFIAYACAASKRYIVLHAFPFAFRF